MKKKKSDVKWYLWPSGKEKAVVFEKYFVMPYVKVNGPVESPSEWPPEKEQKRLEEAALLARWRRKHQPSTVGSRSADRPEAACKRSSGKSRRASR
jgi:hypothetical protein